jgi:CRP/FNR family transcriptional regulator, cyclic AMP receptor protein
MSSTVELLRPIPLFTALSSEKLGRVAELCETKSCESGEYIFREGEPGNRLFIIVEGGVRISRQTPGAGEEALAVLERNALFGDTNESLRSFLALSMF